MLDRIRLRTTSLSRRNSPDRYSQSSSIGRKRSYRPSRSSSSESEGPSWRQSRESKCLKSREYLLFTIEAAVSVASRVINERVTRQDQVALKITVHQSGIYGLYVEGYSALVSMFIGCITDSYFSYYAVAVFSVVIHFVAASICLMEEVIRGYPKGNQYDLLVRNICIVAIVLMKATNFTRLIYGLEGMAGRRKSIIYVYLFLHFWVSSDATYGGIINTIFSAVWEHTEHSAGAFRLPIVPFVLTGFSLFLFVYILQPETSGKEQRGLGCRVVNCLLLATFYKIFRIQKRGKKGFLGSTDKTYDKTTISGTKGILVLYALILPSLGIVLATMMNTSLLYEQLVWRLKTGNLLRKIGILRLARIIGLITMLCSYFILWPLLVFMGFKDKPTVKFLVGHLLIVLSLFYLAVLFKTLETYPYSTSSGLVRVFNAREESVQLIPEDRSVASHDLLIGSKDGVMASYPCRGKCLLPMRAVFNGTATNYTTFLSVFPGQLAGYVVLDPPEIARIRGPFLPLREGPPGTNTQGRPRIFIYNTARELRNAQLRIELNQGLQRKTIRVLKPRAGVMTTIVLEPGTYRFSLSQARYKKTVDILEGGFYGVVLYVTTTHRELEIDEIVEPSTASPWPFICRYIVEGLAAGLGYPTLRAIIYNLAPQDLLAMSFAFLAFLEGISSWIQFIGFVTWHYFVTANVVFIYAVLVASFFVMCMFVSIKYMKSI